MHRSPDFQVLFQAVPGAHLLVAPDAPRFTIVDVNRAYLQATQTSRDQVVGKGLFEVFPDNPDDPFADGVRNLRSSLERVLATGKPDRMPVQRYDIRGPSGRFEERHWAPLNVPLVGRDGTVTHILHTVEDVTARVLERRHAVEALEVSEARARDVLAGMLEGFLLLDPDFRVVEANAEACRMDGRPRSGLLGRSHWDLWPASVGTPLEAFYRQVMRDRRPGTTEHRYQVEGRDLWLEVRAYPTGDGGMALFYRDVGDRKAAEEGLRRSEERYRSLFNSLDAGFCVVEMLFDAAMTPVDYRFVEVNPAFESQTGLTGAEGRTARELVPGLESHWFETYGQVALTGRPARFENGSAPMGDRWFDVHAFRVGDPAEHRVAILFTDISDRVRMERALRASQAQFQAIANSIDHMVWSTRPDGFHDFYNQRWYDYTGVPDGTTDGDAWAGMFHPNDQDRAWDAWRHCLATGEPYRIEYRLRHRSGQYRWVLGRAQPVRDADGQIIRWFGTCTDIQDMVEAREVLARSRAELEAEIAERTRERDRMWRLSTDIMLVARFDATIAAVNPAWTAILGWTEEELLGRSFLDLIHPDDVGRTRSEAACLSEGRTTPRFENRYRTKDGGYRWLSWTAVPEDDFIHAVGRDITEERERAEALRVAEEALRQAQKMEAVGQLTGGVAHDFNNLLTIIRSAVEFLRRPDLAEERRRRYVEAISDTVDRAAKLTGQLLAFARRSALKPEVFDVGGRLLAVADMLRTIVGARVQIVTDVGCGTCLVETDASQFETALVNMAVNARDAMDGEGTLTVRVEGVAKMPALRGHGVRHGAFCAVSLTDTGSGIPPDKLTQIFEPFFTTKEVGKGTGLGLSQVYGFAKQSGGDIAVHSVVGKGTTFTLYLPRAEGGQAGASAGEADSTPAEDGRGRRVLVVEDNPEVGSFSTQILQDLGFETSWAANAVEALAKLAEGPGFDAVFTDVVMPGMSGIELGRELRRRYPGLPVVLTSGYSHVLAEEGRHGFELLQKPYAAEELSRVLLRVMRDGKG